MSVNMLPIDAEQHKKADTRGRVAGGEEKENQRRW